MEKKAIVTAGAESAFAKALRGSKTYLQSTGISTDVHGECKVIQFEGTDEELAKALKSGAKSE